MPPVPPWGSYIINQKASFAYSLVIILVFAFCHSELRVIIMIMSFADCGLFIYLFGEHRGHEYIYC